MELNSLLILLEAAEYLERRDRGISLTECQMALTGLMTVFNVRKMKTVSILSYVKLWTCTAIAQL